MDLNDQLFSLSSENIDDRLGFRINEIEHELYLKARNLRPKGNLQNLGHALHNGHQTWIGLDPQTLNTPYSELKLMCALLNPKPGSLVVDLGAGYGRLGIVISAFHPEVNFLGYELVPERVEEGLRIFKKWNYKRGEMRVMDLTCPKFSIPSADYYFIYDYGKLQHIRETLEDLANLVDSKKFQVIARGKGVRSIIEYEHPWLSDVFPVKREEHFSIYSMSSPDNL